MEGKRKSSSQRRVQRCYQCNRFEEELWALAYGELWPLIRRALTEERSPHADPKRPSSDPQLKIGA
jgi:hypothetical protein